jgi:Helix-turn-helix domain
LSVVIANHLRPRREKVFGEGPRVPLEREAKVRIMHLARALTHKTEPGKHYGVLTGKFVDVLHAMLWLIHDGRSGQCNPSYETIAGKAGCAMSTVCEAIKALELAGLLSWVNRIVRVRVRERDLFGHWATTWRVLRTSNAYVFHDPKAAERSKTEIRQDPRIIVKIPRRFARSSIPTILCTALYSPSGELPASSNSAPGRARPSRALRRAQSARRRYQ